MLSCPFAPQAGCSSFGAVLAQCCLWSWAHGLPAGVWSQWATGMLWEGLVTKGPGPLICLLDTQTCPVMSGLLGECQQP